MNFYPVGIYPSADDSPEWVKRRLGTGLKGIWFLGSQEDMSVPAALYLQMPPGYVLFRHGHPCPRFEVVIRGELDVGDGRIAKPGDIFTAEPDELYGPHTAGPEGATTIEIFGNLSAMSRLLWEDDDGVLREADGSKGEVPPTYVPIPGLG